MTTPGANRAYLYVDEMAINHAHATGTGGGSGTMTGRYWQIQAIQSDKSTLASGYVATLTLPHSVAPHTNAKVCRYPGTQGGYGWDCFRTGSDAAMVWLEGVTGFSD